MHNLLLSFSLSLTIRLSTCSPDIHAFAYVLRGHAVDQCLNNKYCDSMFIDMRAIKNAIEKIWGTKDNLIFVISFFVYCCHCIMIKIVVIEINTPIYHGEITKG